MAERELFHARPAAKDSVVVPISNELMDEYRGTAAALTRLLFAAPAERAQWAAEAKERNRAARAAAPHVDLTLDRLLDKLGFTRAYAEHLVQPYCNCGDGMDGWERCQHARDLNLGPGVTA